MHSNAIRKIICCYKVRIIASAQLFWTKQIKAPYILSQIIFKTYISYYTACLGHVAFYKTAQIICTMYTSASLYSVNIRQIKFYKSKRAFVACCTL